MPQLRLYFQHFTKPQGICLFTPEKTQTSLACLPFYYNGKNHQYPSAFVWRPLRRNPCIMLPKTFLIQLNPYMPPLPLKRPSNALWRQHPGTPARKLKTTGPYENGAETTKSDKNAQVLIIKTSRRVQQFWKKRNTLDAVNIRTVTPSLHSRSSKESRTLQLSHGLDNRTNESKNSTMRKLRQLGLLTNAESYLRYLLKEKQMQRSITLRNSKRLSRSWLQYFV